MGWPFDQPPNCATFVTRGLIESKNLFVSHDEDDHGWQVHDSLNGRAEGACMVCLSQVLELDPTMRELADLSPGWVDWLGKPASRPTAQNLTVLSAPS